MQSELLDNGAERKCREEGEAAHENHGAHKKRDELHPMRWQRARGSRHGAFSRQRPSDAEHRHDDEEAAREHGSR